MAAIRAVAGRTSARLRWWLRQRADRPGWWLAACGVALGGAVLCSVASGSVRIPLGELPRALGETEHPLHAVLTRVRLPRIVAAAEVGAALAVAGLLLQTALRNPLADAGLLGVSAGAGLAAMLVLTLAPAAAALVPVAAFVGGLAAVGVLLLAASLAGSRPTPLALLLAGVALQAILFACIAVLTLLFADRAPAFVGFTVGSLAATGWREVVAALVPLAIGVGAAALLSRTLDLLLFDEASAIGLGVAVPRTRLLIAALAATLCAAAVSIAGLVGFVGLLVPNAVRLALGNRHRILVPFSVVVGALLVVLADLAARTVAAPIELPVGAILALLGGPFFLFLLFRRVEG